MVNNIQDLRDISYVRHIRRGTQEYVGGVLMVVSDVVEYGHQVGACPQTLSVATAIPGTTN